MVIWATDSLKRYFDSDGNMFHLASNHFNRVYDFDHSIVDVFKWFFLVEMSINSSVSNFADGKINVFDAILNIQTIFRINYGHLVELEWFYSPKEKLNVGLTPKMQSLRNLNEY